MDIYNNIDDYMYVCKYIAKTEFNFNDIELKYIDKFWDQIVDDVWIYLSKDIICKDFEYNQYSNNHSITFYENILSKYYVLNTHYKNVQESDINNKTFSFDSTSKLNNITKKSTLKQTNHYIISPECYKSILLLIKTGNCIQLSDYYFKIEQIYIKSCKYISSTKSKLNEEKLLESVKQLDLYKQEEMNRNRELMEQLSLEKQKVNELRKMLMNTKQSCTNEIIYIACNQELASKNKFIFGGLKSEHLLDKKLELFNKEFPSNDLIFYCYKIEVNKYTIIEDIIQQLVPSLIDDNYKEIQMINMYYSDLKSLVETICDNEKNQIMYIKMNMETIIHNIVNEKFIPTDIFQ